MPARRKKILVTHPWVARGGSEATAMWALDALQDDFRVTFATAEIDSWDEMNAAYGTAIQSEKVWVARCSRLPLVNSPNRLVRLQHRHFEKFCQSIALRFDLCISAYNPVNFGDAVPSLQLIGDFSFSEKLRRKLYVNADSNFHHRESLLRRIYLKAGEWIGVEQRPLAKRKNDRVIANSQWAGEQLAAEFNLPNAPILYPPVMLPAESPDVEKRPLSFVWLGRISPEKEIEKIVGILVRVRRETGREDISLTLIGQLGGSDYSRRIETLIEENSSWITPAGFLAGEAKQERVAEHEFALHGCRIEAFGIAVAEMAALGCVPVVPADGGAREIAEFSELLYADESDAVAKIIRLIENPARAAELRNHFAGSLDRFHPEAFRVRLRTFVDRCFRSGSTEKPRPGHAEKNSPAPV